MQVVGMLVAFATLWALQVGLLGCAYLLLGAIAIATPNYHRPTRLTDDPATAITPASRRHVPVAHTVESVALAVLLALHTAGQYALMAALFPIKQNTCRFLERAIGLRCGLPRYGNLVSLGAPVALCACLALYRCAPRILIAREVALFFVQDLNVARAADNC
jgi:hypothetical protein